MRNNLYVTVSGTLEDGEAAEFACDGCEAVLVLGSRETVDAAGDPGREISVRVGGRFAFADVVMLARAVRAEFGAWALLRAVVRAMLTADPPEMP